MPQSITAYADVNEVLRMLQEGLVALLDTQLISLYLTGSLTYGDFARGSSDIDFLAVVSSKLSEAQIVQVQYLHEGIGQRIKQWATRVEGSYVPSSWLKRIARPTALRPYVNGGQMKQYTYGNEWVLNLFVLQERGIALYGPPPKQLITPVTIEPVREASRRDLYEDWEPKLTNPLAFLQPGYESDHLRTYATLTMCRILHRSRNDEIVSKLAAAQWVQQSYPAWASLVEAAQHWSHGDAFATDDEVKDFIRFTITEVH